MISIWNIDLISVQRCTQERGTLVQSHNLILDFNRKIQEREQGKTYKYLGIKIVRAYNNNTRKND
jgi:hypothetical protein